MSYSDLELHSTRSEGYEGFSNNNHMHSCCSFSVVFSPGGCTVCEGYTLPLSSIATVVIGSPSSLSLKQEGECGGEGKGLNHCSYSSDQFRTRCFLTRLPACPCLLVQEYLRRHTSEHTVQFISSHHFLPALLLHSHKDYPVIQTEGMSQSIT